MEQEPINQAAKIILLAPGRGPEIREAEESVESLDKEL